MEGGHLIYLPSRRKRFYLKRSNPMVFNAEKAKVRIGQLCAQMIHVDESGSVLDLPPPSKADAAADAVRLEDLKARLIAAGGCSG